MAGKVLKYGFTTGACAAAAAKGAAEMLRDQRVVETVEITLPTGDTVSFSLRGQTIRDGSASCYVVKDAGDDPDVTHGAEIHARVAVEFFAPHRIRLEGGAGIGRVTKPGLAVPVGEWAINPVPRRMILEGVKEVFAMRCLPATLTVTLSIPDGAERGKKTLNERIGIMGGLSILGTTGIVKPLSHKAWIDTIDTALDVALACGSETIVLSTGRTSELAAQKFFGTRDPGPGTRENLRDEAFIMMGDHVGHAVRSCSRKKAGRVIIAAQFAKLVKIACGCEQTHASSSDLDLKIVSEWLSGSPGAGHLADHARRAHTARELLELSGRDPGLVSLVCGRAKEFLRGLAPGLDVRVLLAGYGSELLYFG